MKMNKLLLIPIPFIVLSFYIPVQAAEYRPWSDAVFQEVEKEYGGKAKERLLFIHNLILKNQNRSIPEKLDLVNTTMNHLPWIADAEHWKKEDYWATPMESIATFGGDCEDIAILKWVALNHLGIPSNHLKLAYTKIRATGESHMVLLYFEKPDAPPDKQIPPLVLDNYTEEIRPAPARRDLIAVYLTDAKGNIIIIEDNGMERSVKGTFAERKMKRLEDLKKKIRANALKFQELNDGHPLFPSLQ